MPPYLSIVFMATGVVLILIFHMFIVWWAVKRGFDTSTVGQGNEETATGLSRNDVNKLPFYYFNNDCGGEETGSGPTMCAVCLESFRTGDKCRLLPVCKHSFHAECVDSWLLKSPLCPICRSNVNSRHTVVDISESSH